VPLSFSFWAPSRAAPLGNAGRTRTNTNTSAWLSTLRRAAEQRPKFTASRTRHPFNHRSGHRTAQALAGKEPRCFGVTYREASGATPRLFELGIDSLLAGLALLVLVGPFSPNRRVLLALLAALHKIPAAYLPGATSSTPAG
jgi:hypothetical protein